jgi:ABC-type glycerol-3-phosphate transport system permease component
MDNVSAAKTNIETTSKPEKRPLGVKIRRFFHRERRINRSAAGNGLLFALMAICAVFMSMPLIMTINNAFKPLDELFQFPPRILVRYPTMENFGDLFVLMTDSWVPFSRYMLNTIIITGFGTVGHVIVAAMAAYPLAKHSFKGQKFLFSMVVLAMMFNWVAIQIPSYIVVTLLGINNTHLALILPAWSFSMGLFLMKQFMEQIPTSIIESARIDGAGEFKIFWRIVMPNVKPAWLTLAIFQFQALWINTGQMFLRSEELRPLQFAMQFIQHGGAARVGASAAVGLILAAVPITFFLICQSNILETMTTSGLKD